MEQRFVNSREVRQIMVQGFAKYDQLLSDIGTTLLFKGKRGRLLVEKCFLILYRYSKN